LGRYWFVSAKGGSDAESVPKTSSVETWRNRNASFSAGGSADQYAHDVRIDEVARAVDRPVDVALGGEVDDCPYLVLGQEPLDEAAVGDVAADKGVPWVARQAVEVPDVAGVGELVEVYDTLARGGEPVDHEVGADEAGAAGDEDHGAGGVVRNGVAASNAR
jgi:hypothetical protein